MIRTRSKWVLVEDEINDSQITIRDCGAPKDVRVTNDAVDVVYWLYINGILGDQDKPRRLFYYDRKNRRDEIVHNGRGEFIGFVPCL